MLVLNAGSVNLYNQLRAELLEEWKHCTTAQGAVTLYQNLRDRIYMYNSSNDEPEENEIDAGHAAILLNINVREQKRVLQGLSQSHNADTIEASKQTKHIEETTMSTTAINIESMSLQELAELQLKIAQRMSELVAKHGNIVENPKECDIPQEKLEEVVVPKVVEAKPKAAARVKKSKESDEARLLRRIESDKIMVRNAGIAKPDVVKEGIEKNDAETQVAAPTSDVNTMKYAELRSFISAATKSSAKAKEHAQSIARKYGAKSWATVGRSGYEEIFTLINA